MTDLPVTPMSTQIIKSVLPRMRVTGRVVGCVVADIWLAFQVYDCKLHYKHHMRKLGGFRNTTLDPEQVSTSLLAMYRCV